MKPTVLNFKGFQVKKTVVKKVTVKNVSETPQRVAILPTNTAFFKPKFNKRGNLAPGLSEEIFVQFIPSEWRYHYDCLRILSHGGNLNIPIHAFPVMNEKDRYLPTLIDLGKCGLGERIVKTIPLECTIPISFDYEIRVLKGHQDLGMSPLVGEVPGNSSVNITIVYEPRTASTVTCEIELRVNEFDYVPILTKIIASGYHKAIETTSKNKTETGNTSQSKILLRVSKDFAEKSGKKLPEVAASKRISNKTSMMMKTKEIDRSVYEQQFNNEYRTIEQADREKEFKIYRTVGNSHPDEDFRENVIKSRQSKEKSRQEGLRKRDCSRIEVIRDIDRVIYDVIDHPAPEAIWDEYTNDDFALRQLPLNKFVRAANTLIIRHRADKRISQIKQKLQQNNVRNREDAKKFVTWDWKQADIIGYGQTDFIPFEVSITSTDVQPIEITLEYESPLDEFKQKLQIHPQYSFDSLQPLSYIETQDFRMLNYSDFVCPVVSHYLYPELERENRPGAEEEYAQILPKGEAGQFSVIELPETCYKPPVNDPVSQVRPSPTLRTYANVLPITEVSYEFDLKPRVISRDLLEEYPGRYIPEDSLLQTEWRPRHEHRPISQPDSLTGVRPSELLSDSDSDSENVFNLEAPDLDRYLSTFESEDDVMKNYPAMKNSHSEALDRINSRLEEQRRRDRGILPTYMSQMNKQIVSSENKVSLT